MATNEYVYSHSPKWNGNPKDYLNRKLRILTKDFRITPKADELKYLQTLDTQIKIDNAIFNLINSAYWIKLKRSVLYKWLSI